jgi:hypothetical protein
MSTPVDRFMCWGLAPQSVSGFQSKVIGGPELSIGHQVGSGARSSVFWGSIAIWAPDCGVLLGLCLGFSTRSNHQCYFLSRTEQGWPLSSKAETDLLAILDMRVGLSAIVRLMNGIATKVLEIVTSSQRSRCKGG